MMTLAHEKPARYTETPTVTDTSSHRAAGRSRASGAWTLLAALAALLAGVAIIVAVGQAMVPGGPTDGLPDDYDSTSAVELREELPDEATSTAIVLFSAGPADGGDELDRTTLGQLQGVVQQVRADLDLGEGPPVVPSRDGTAATAVLELDAGAATDVSAAVKELRAALTEASPDGVEVGVTGPAAIRADLSAVFEGADRTLLVTTAGVVALLLLLTYRSPVLWLIPLLVVAVADRLAAVLASQALTALGMGWNESTVGILSVLVFGAGTNYALLLISRYRDELKTTDDRRVAMQAATVRTAHAVLASAGTVVIGVLTLLLSVVPTTRSLGVACAIGVVIAAAFVLLVLPPILASFGRWVFWPRVPHVGDATLVEGRGLWRRIGDRVARRPAVLVVGAAVLLSAMAAGIPAISTGLSGGDRFLDEPEAITAAERLAESFPAGSADPLQVLTRDRPEAVRQAVADVPDVVRAEVSAQGAGVAQVDVIIGSAPGTDESEDALLAVRSAVSGFTDTHVGGTQAELTDSRAAAGADQRLLLPVIAGLVVLALIVLLRSLVAPLLLVATVMTTYAASLGVSWWLFTGVMGFEALDVGVPLLAFVFLVALGVDYNIFLVTRGLEEARDHGTASGMIRSLTATGGVITSAGILLAAVFAVLGVLPLVVLAQLGVVICVGVLLDTLLVRTVVVPALAVWLGERFWWPRQVRTTTGA